MGMKPQLTPEQAVIVTLIDSRANTTEEFETMLRQWLDGEYAIVLYQHRDEPEGTAYIDWIPVPDLPKGGR